LWICCTTSCRPTTNPQRCDTHHS